ncbi:hypothetical protein GJ744_002552 [Endocarpon pusillum]|uniref:Cytochrome b-c1 complex subunit 10 n=1 Tax=Endocarpon pusillum TaxID=364733 RepID=A0A8H7AFG9_9EURO|nr:hypothetical protein GJ744_002552 [Endocarpon pusillum]
MPSHNCIGRQSFRARKYLDFKDLLLFPSLRFFASRLVKSTMVRGQRGVDTWTQRPSYTAYKSPYGPVGTIAAGFGASAGIFALFFFAEVPKVRNDILSKMPFIGDYYVREVPPEDNPF